jgi:tetratricopeptide (TPR) repeat protein
MSYDLFISYSRADNQQGQVAELKAQIESSFRSFGGPNLQIFFDTQAIQGMDDWRQKIQRSLRESRLFLAVLSPNYIASPYCRWEWEDYVRYEAMRQCLGEGVAPVFFVTLPDAATASLDPAIQRWIDEINQRQTFDLRTWREHGEKALKESHVRTTLEQLHASVRERLDRAQRAQLSPNNLIKHNAAFVGRVRELTDLRNALSMNKLGVVGARQGKAPGPVAVQGLGGMGKTELALAYAHAFAWDYPGGRWQIPCEYTADLRLALTRLAGPMKFEFTEDEKKDLALQFERVLREIDKRERCLLILDNVSDPHLLEPEYLDRLPRNGHVDLIATTRLAPNSIPGSAQDLTFIAVDELPEEDALALMRSHQPTGRFASEDEENEARRIVQLLRGFTLAVETAAIYLGRHAAPDACRKFRERLSPDLLRESEQAATDPTVAVRHRIRSLDETLAFTLATLTHEAMELLTFASLLPADQVAVPWLRALAAERYPAFKDEQSSAFQTPLELLLGLRLFQPGDAVDAKGHLLIVRVHRLVQDLIRQKTGAEDLAVQQQAIDTLIKERDAILEATTEWMKARWELEPLAGLAGLWDEANHPQAAWLLNQAGMRWHTLGEWGRTEPLYRRALEIWETNLGPDHPNVASALRPLGNLLRITNRLLESESLHSRALEIDEKSSEPNQIAVARDLNNLASLFEATNRTVEAEALYRRALAIWETTDQPDIAICLNNLAGLLYGRGRVTEAELLFRRALDLDQNRYGADGLPVVNDLSNLALLLRTTDRLAEAESLMRRALEIQVQGCGPEQPDVAAVLSNLGGLLSITDRPAEAEPLYRRALEVLERNLGSDHPIVAAVLHNLGVLLHKTNRLVEAEALLCRALAINQKSYGADHSTIKSSLRDLLWVQRARLLEVESTESLPQSSHSTMRGELQLARTMKAHGGAILALAYSAHHQTLISGGQDSLLRLCSTEPLRMVHEFRGHEAPVSGISVGKDGQSAVSGAWDQTIRIWDLTELAKKPIVQALQSDICGVATSRHGKLRTVFALEDGLIGLWDEPENNSPREIGRHGYTASAIAMSDDGQVALSGSTDQTVKLWQLRSGGSVSLPGHVQVTSTCVNHDGSVGVSGGADGLIIVWNLESCEMQRILKGHTKTISALAISSDNRWIASASWDKTVRIWDTYSGELLATFSLDEQAWAMAVSPTFNSIYVGDKEGFVHQLVFTEKR